MPDTPAVTAPPSADDLRFVHNRTFDEIAIGDTAAIERTLTAEDIQLFAVMSGDANPQHLDPEFAATTPFHGVIAHGMWGAALISGVLGTRLPGPGTIYLAQTLKFLAPVHIGDTLTIRVTVRAKDDARKRLLLDCSCIDQAGHCAIQGEAEVLAPVEKITRPRTALPEVRLTRGNDGAQRLLDYVKPMAPIRMAVVHPCDECSLGGALDAHRAGLIEPVLIAPRERLLAVAAEARIDLGGILIEDVPHSHAAAQRAVEMAAAGEVDALMKGSLHTEELMGAVVRAGSGLRTKRRISH